MVSGRERGCSLVVSYRSIITGAGQAEAWAMATGIDLGFVALELSQLAAVSDKVRRQIARFAAPTRVSA
jgi:hypothetical protein